MDWKNLTTLATGERNYDMALKNTKPGAGVAIDQLVTSLIVKKKESILNFHFIGLGVGVSHFLIRTAMMNADCRSIKNNFFNEAESLFIFLNHFSLFKAHVAGAGADFVEQGRLPRITGEKSFEKSYSMYKNNSQYMFFYFSFKK